MMNASLDQFMNGLEEAVDRLPAILAGWSELDAELRIEYASQFEWMLEVREQAESMAADADRIYEIAERLARANTVLFGFRELMERLMGIRADEVVERAVTVKSDDIFIANDNAYAGADVNAYAMAA